MKCSRCDTSCAPHELRPYPPTEHSLCLDCLWAEFIEALDILQREAWSGCCFCRPLDDDDPCTWCRAKTFVDWHRNQKRKECNEH